MIIFNVFNFELTVGLIFLFTLAFCNLTRTDSKSISLQHELQTAHPLEWSHAFVMPRMNNCFEQFDVKVKDVKHRSWWKHNLIIDEVYFVCRGQLMIAVCMLKETNVIWHISKKKANNLVHSLNGNINPLSFVMSSRPVLKCGPGSDLILNQPDNILKTQVISRAAFKAKLNIIVNDDRDVDITKVRDLLAIQFKTGRDYRLSMQLLDMYILVDKYLKSPSLVSYRSFVTHTPFPNLINKLQLYPCPGLTVKMWSLKQSLNVFFSGKAVGVTVCGEVVESVGSPMCFESILTRLNVPAMDVKLACVGYDLFVDTTSARDPDLLFDKLCKLYQQMSLEGVSGLPIVHVHNHCVIKDPKTFYPDRRNQVFTQCNEVGQLFRAKSDSWVAAFCETVDKCMLELIKNDQYEVPDEEPTQATVVEATDLYKGGSLMDKIAWIRRSDDSYCNKETLDNLLAGLRCSDLKDTVMYSGAVQLPDLEDAKVHLESFLDSVDDIMLKLVRCTAKQEYGVPYWVTDDFSLVEGDKRVFEQEIEDIVFKPNHIAAVMNITEEETGVINVRLAPNPVKITESKYFLNTMLGPKSREPGSHKLRSVTTKDVIECEKYKDDVVSGLSKKCDFNKSLNIWERKKWISSLAPPALRQAHVTTVDALGDLELGNMLTHQFEIGNIVQMSLINTKKHRYCLARNGHNVSYTLIKCSAGGNAFKNCPIKVFWLSSENYPTRHDEAIVPITDDGVRTMYMRNTKWHNIDSRMLTWYINQPLVVESRILSVQTAEPQLMATPMQMALCSLPTFPNTQDFSKLTGPLRNAIDSLDSIESEPGGITQKMEGLTVSSKLELWYTLDYLTTFMIGRVLHKARVFEKGGSLKNDKLGTLLFKFPEFDSMTSHPELITNFRNTYHHVVKNKVNKLGPEARDFLAIVEEFKIYNKRESQLKPGGTFGWTPQDILVLKAPELNKQHVRQSLVKTWEACQGSKDSLRYQWNIWFQLRSIAHDQRHNSHGVTAESDWWAKMFNTTIDEYLTATGSMESGRVELDRKQSRRKSTSVYELIVMIENDTLEIPNFLKTKVADMVKKQSACTISMGVICLHLLARGGDPAIIRILDKDQVEGEREISALDVLSMLCCSIHEKSWSIRNRHHPVDAILTPDKPSALRNLWTSLRDKMFKDSVLLCHGRDCSRYGPNQDMQMLALNASILMNDAESLLTQLACQSLYLKGYKPPESLASAYMAALSSSKGVVRGSGVVNEALCAIAEHCGKDGMLHMKGGMGQGILGIGASYSTSMAVNYTNFLLKLGSKRVRAVASAQTSDDGADVYEIAKKKMYSTARWISSSKKKMLCMSNNITNPTKSGLRFTSMELNGIRNYAKDDNELIETTQTFKMLSSKVAVPDTMSFVEDCIKANLYAADLLKSGIPAEVVLCNCTHSLMLCYHLHKKWSFLSEAKYLSIPALFGGPIGPCFIQCCITPLAPILVFSGGMINHSSQADLEELCKCILRTHLLEEDAFVHIDDDFGDAPALYKKSVDGLRFVRRPSKNDRKAFDELFKKGYTTGAVPNLIYTNRPVSLAESTETFIHKLTTGQASNTQPNNKYLVTWGMYRKSYIADCITVAEGSPMSFVVPDGKAKMSPEYLKQLILGLDQVAFAQAMSLCALKSQENAGNVLTEGRLYDAMLRQMVSKFEMVGEVTSVLSSLHYSVAHLDPSQRPLNLHPLTTSVVRSRRDIINLEQEMRKKIFTELTGQPGSDYLFDTFGVRTTPIKKPSMDVKRGMLLCEQYASVITEFLTLKDRQLTLRSKYAVRDDKSMVSQLIKYNMSYNKEFFFDDTELLRIRNPPLKEFVSNFWEHDVEEDAIKINNSLALREVYDYGYQPTPIFLKSDVSIKSLDDLYRTTTSYNVGDPAVFEVADTSYASNKLIQMAVVLNSQVLFTNNSLLKHVYGAGAREEKVSSQGIHCAPTVLKLHGGGRIETVEVVNKVSGVYEHETILPESDATQSYLIDKPIDSIEDKYILTTMAERNLRVPKFVGGHVSVRAGSCIAPLFKLELIDFDWSSLEAGAKLNTDGGTYTDNDIIDSQLTGNPQPSLHYPIKNLVSRNTAQGYLGSLGTSEYYRRSIISDLTSPVPVEEPYHADRTFAQLFSDSVDPKDDKLSPFARICVMVMRSTVAPIRQQNRVGFLGNLLGSAQRSLKEQVKELDATLSRPVLAVVEKAKEVTIEEETVPDTDYVAGDDYDPFEDADIDLASLINMDKVNRFGEI